jgi:hypothetical protein
LIAMLSIWQAGMGCIRFVDSKVRTRWLKMVMSRTAVCFPESRVCAQVGRREASTVLRRVHDRNQRKRLWLYPAESPAQRRI